MPTTEIEPSVGSAPAEPRSKLLVRGLTWTVAYQLVEVACQFGSMLVLVRIIQAQDYGRAAAVTGLLALLNTFNAHLFIEHALQQPDGEEPDWQLHWSAAFHIQLGLSLIGNALAGLCWLSVKYRPLAGLLHVAALGLLIDGPSQVSSAMLRRDLDIRRVRILGTVAMSVRLVATISLALAGAGPYALVLGNNVAPACVLAADLFFVRRWRPRRGWHRAQWWREYSAAAAFGLQRAGAQIIVSLRGAMESTLLPIPLGFTQLGLINRAQVLYSNTFGRAGTVIADVVYPFLPRSSNQPARFASHATLYLQVMLMVGVPSALFVAEHGPLLSRVLYGTRWVTMDPLIRPGSLVGLSVSLLATAAAILMAAGRIRECLVLEGIGTIGTVPALAVAWIGRDAVTYSWVCAGLEALTAAAALWRAKPLLQHGWFRRAVVPPFASAFVGLAFLRFCPSPFTGHASPIVQLAYFASIYALVNLLALRLAFAGALDQLLVYVPAGAGLRRFVRLRAAAPPLSPSVASEL